MDSKNNIIVAGHRGYKSKYPENTLISFQKALDLGVDMIEFDLNLTKDKKLVVIHDTTVDRTTNGSGPVREFTLCEIKKLDAGSWFSSEFKSQVIPTLEELLETVSYKKDLLYNVEIKDKTHETVDLTIDTLKKFGILDRCVMTCFDASIIRYIKTVYNLKCQGFPGFLMQNFEEGEAGTYSMLYSVGIELKYLTKDLVNYFEEKNILPWAYCVDDEEWARKVLEVGCTLATCNNPVPALKVFREKG
jgi:glycerophosphoryl diester phosphodiesterase